MIKIDVDNRYWQIPKEECFLGVESDDKVKILQFELSKNEFYEGLNFTDCNCFINYKNEDNDTIPYGITDMELQEDGTVTFTWQVSRGATIFKGNTFAVLCAKKVREDGNITNEWNSRIGSFTVAKGLEPSSSITEVPEIDIISQLLLVAQQTNANAQNNINQSSQLLEKAEGLGYLKEEYDVLEARMNQFTSLQEGSTTGDAELQDIRVGSDGKTYDTAGDAVRGQIGELKGDLANIIYKGLINGFDKDNTVGGYLSNNGNVNSDSRYVTSDYFDVHENKTYYALQMVGTVKYDNVSYICFYDSSKTFITGGYFNASSCTSPNGSKYARVTFPSDETIKARCMFTSVEIPDKYYPFGYEYSIITKDVSELKTNVSELKTSKFENRLYGKSMAILGDSMAKGHTLAEEQTWAYKIASRNNMTYQKVAVNGAFITTGHGDSADANCLLQQLSRITGNPDIIIIHMGTNDRVQNTDIGNWSSGNTDTTNIYGALRVAFEYILEHFTTSKVMFITPYYYREQTDYIGAIENACNGIGTVHCKNNKQGGICAWNDYVKSTYFIDTVHLNELGQERASYEYEGFMRTFM